MNETPTASARDKHFNHKEREAELYKLWEQAGVFKPESAKDQKAPVFNIAMPPPNANGELHLGHAFGYTVMDIFGRFHRLLGERVLLIPGKDHAGIQTQVVFEKKLKSEGVDTTKIPVKELYEQCYAFCQDRAGYMRAQEKTLGISADWDRELFTLDPRLNDIVFETFEKLWADDLVYKGHRMVNWSVFSQTSISDVEVEYKEQDGHLWYISYVLEGGPIETSDKIKLPNGTEIPLGNPGIYSATTRPETMLGDTALAVHPDDERYKKFVGKRAIVPIVNRSIPIVADTRVDPTYGTGVIKITPAHDFADYDIGVDHKIEAIQVIGKDGKMTEAAGAAYAGLKSAECRTKVIEKLTEEGKLLDTVKIKHKVPIGERGKDIIEPLISEQWFVNVDKPGMSLKENALKLLRSGKIQIFPSRFMVLFEQWLENLRDWNISRQLWWGHQLPVWHRTTNDKTETKVGRNCPEGDGWERETDVFDTWFSSGQWAYSTTAACGQLNLDNPVSNNPFFPTHTMVMGRDILFFWASRMLLLTTYRLKDVPWKNIYFTGLIRDEHGQKMSKSKGNGIDPNATIEKFGADALRLALIMGASPGNDIALSERKIEGYSKFGNKLWNASKLIEMKVGAKAQPLPAKITLASNRWILSEFSQVHSAVTQKLNEYEISIAANELYNFTWFTFCDKYLEMMKVLTEMGTDEQRAETASVAAATFGALLTLLHPFIPFITEEIYQTLSCVNHGGMLATGSWKNPFPSVVNEEKELLTAMEVVAGIRSVKAALVIPHKKIRVSLTHTLSSESILLIQELGKVEFCAASEIPAHLALRKPVLEGVVICEVEGKENYRQRLEKDITQYASMIENIEKKLSGDFAKQAKPELVEKEREKLELSIKAVAELRSELALFS